MARIFVVQAALVASAAAYTILDVGAAPGGVDLALPVDAVARGNSSDSIGGLPERLASLHWLWDDAAVDALCLELEQTVDALVAFHGEEDAEESSVSRLDTCASALTNQAIVFVQSNALEWVQRLMRRGLEVCEKSDAHALHWKPVFDQAWEKVSTEIRADYEGASLVLR